LPSPETAADPTTVPPLVQVVGALACGPKTENVTVPVEPLVDPESVPLIELAEIAVPAAPVDGAVAAVVVVLPLKPSGGLISSASVAQVTLLMVSVSF
jgi:hypothetical protein